MPRVVDIPDTNAKIDLINKATKVETPAAAIPVTPIVPTAKEDVQPEIPQGILPLDEVWSRTPLDAQAEWFAAASYLDTIEEADKVTALKSELKTLKGKSPRKREIQAQIDEIHGRLGLAQAAYEDAMISQAQALGEQVRQKSLAQGITDEATLAKIQDEFLQGITPERPNIGRVEKERPGQ